MSLIGNYKPDWWADLIKTGNKSPSMKWQKKHDIILKWIDSCKTFEQLHNLVPFVKSQSFDIDDLLLMIRLKAVSIYAGFVVVNMEERIKILKR